MKIQISLPLFLTIMLWVLDLSGAIDIAWYWIIAPFWLPFAIVLPLTILLTILYYIIPRIFSDKFRKEIDQKIKLKDK